MQTCINLFIFNIYAEEISIDKWRSQISELEHMGFTDRQHIIALLEKNEGNIENVIDALLSA